MNDQEATGGQKHCRDQSDTTFPPENLNFFLETIPQKYERQHAELHIRLDGARKRFCRAGDDQPGRGQYPESLR